ncbi:acyl-CoA/acyl-ACP dehydrogenase [Bradyrhizobium lablabi]|uniref:acyl-CoA dehydrogenase family protein n=1 Tax=Bradyrhizobium lablabi TaxID=722472 RepID=UPI001BA87F82|nr:acyl-CoA dehydrogenase family protein [Bradyrhizobium lablabi]MBR1125673.1 acyl-CoA/acyl-ACP dehydrogenase [Bradyrhizobium lablabi]
MPSGALPRFELSAGELELLAFARAVTAPYAAREQGPLPLATLREIFRKLEPSGYLGSILPLAAGGKGLSPLAFAALVEGLSPSLPLLGNHSVQRYLHDFGSPAQRKRFLPGLLSGDDIGAIAISETQAASDLSRIETVARRHGRGWKITGRKTWVTHGMVASLFIVLARSGETPEHFTRFIVTPDMAGFARRPLEPIGLTHLSFAELELNDCEVSDEMRLGGEGEGASGAKTAFPIARVLAALQALGIARAAIDIAADYARQRIVAGVALAERSLVQRGHAELWARIEAARLLSYRAVAGLGSSDANMLASGAKAIGGELALEACQWAADCLGSSGLPATHHLHRLQNDARMMSVVDGTSLLNHLVVARRGIARGFSPSARY